MELLQRGSSLLKCAIGEWFMTYLGVTVGLSPRSKNLWAQLVNRIDSRLANWKCSNLDMVGRIVLLKATFDSLPSYRFNLFVMLSGVCQKIETIHRNFLWGEYEEEGVMSQKLHLLSWHKLMQQKTIGGLDIVLVKHKNQVVLAKWWVKWLTDRKSSWHEIVRNKYNCQPYHNLGDALTGKIFFPFMRGIININNDKVLI